jgi:DNA-binding transcriptional LysR family regulator
MNPDLELRHLRYFVAVAEELHFGRAAKKLHLSQPPLSQQIRRLEEILGYALLLRTSRSVALTSAGEAFLERSRRTLRNVEHDIDETRRIGQGEVGSLNIGFVGSAILVGLPAIFRAYRDSFPRVQMRLYESFTSRVIEGLENGTLDAGILRDGDMRETLNMTPLFTEPYVAVLPATHRCAGQKSISPGVLRNDPFIYFPRSAGTRAFEKPLAVFEEYGFRPQIVQEASHWLTILSLVGVGLGVSVAPACVGRIAPPEVVCIPFRGAKVVSTIELARLVGDARPIVERFFQAATNVLIG